MSQSFTVDFDAIPSNDTINAVTSLSFGNASSDAPGSIVVRFASNGMIDAMNGTAFDATSAVQYQAGTAYHFHIDINMDAAMYTVLVTPDGGIEQVVAANFSFPDDVQSLNNIAVQATSGSHLLFNVKLQLPVSTQPPLTATPTPTPATAPTPNPTPTSTPAATPNPTPTPTPQPTATPVATPQPSPTATPPATGCTNWQPSGTVVNVSPGSDIQGAINNAGSGTILKLAAGDYNVTSGIQMKSGVSVSCAAGAVLHSQGSQTIFALNGVSDVSVWGCDFDGTNTAGQYSAAVFVVSTNNVHINYNNFRNFTKNGYLMMYNSDNFSFSGNTNNNNSGNEFEPASTVYGDGKSHYHIYFTDNNFSGFSRIGIEAQLDHSYDIHFDRNTIYLNYAGTYLEGIALSIVSNAGPALPASGTISGNVVKGQGIGWGIELGTMNMTVSNNNISGLGSAIIPSSAPGSAILNNTLTNNRNPFAEDGGYADDSWYGTNIINGTNVTGWAGHGTSVMPTFNTPSQPFCRPN